MLPKNNEPTQAVIKDTFDYIDGNLVRRRTGKVLVPKKGEYKKAMVNGEYFLIHRLVWIMHKGTIPHGHLIDHINQIKSDNRIENLRVVTYEQNKRNQKKYKTNTSGITGVCWYPKYKKWQARINVDGKRKHIGYFSKKEDAKKAREKYQIELGYSFT